MAIKKFDSINVVPMIDIMLVLLVIVLTTATFIAKGIIPLELPNAKSASKYYEHKKIEISISKDGKIYLNGEAIENKEALSEKLEKNRRDVSVYISCDKKADYDYFVNVLDTLKKLGFPNINIVTSRWDILKRFF